MCNYSEMRYPLSPEEMQAVIRRAEAERREAIRRAFAALLFRRRAPDPAGELAGRTAPACP